MEVRKELYNDITMVLQQLNNVPIKRIDLWNENVYFVEQEQAFPMPAVFVEFGAIEWEMHKGPKLSWRGKGTVRIHIVTPWCGSAEDGAVEREANLAYWDLAEQIHAKLEGLTGEDYHNLSLIQTLTNHNHEDIVENIEVYKVMFDREI